MTAAEFATFKQLLAPSLTNRSDPTGYAEPLAHSDEAGVQLDQVLDPERRGEFDSHVGTERDLPRHPFQLSGPGGTCGYAFDPEFKNYCGLPPAHDVHDAQGEPATENWCDGIRISEPGPDGLHVAARCGSTSSHDGHWLDGRDDLEGTDSRGNH